MAHYNNNVVYKRSDLRRIVFYIAFSLVFIIFSGSLSAQEQNMDMPIATSPYLVSGIEVDITADNAVEAREQAFEVAQVKAYEVLAKRLLSPEELEGFVTPSVNEISAFVRDYEVTNEKISAVRYNGTYQIRFSPKTFSKQKSIDGPAIQSAGDTLVIPFYQRAGRSFLWQANPFMQAWVRARDNQQAGRFIVPVGDVDDITQIGDNQVANYDPSRLNSMRLRYQAQQVALMTAEPMTRPDGSRYIELSLYNAQPYGPELAQRLTISAYPGEVEDQLYNRVVKEALSLSSKAVPENNSMSGVLLPNNQSISPNYPSINMNQGTLSTTEVQTTFSSVREWLQMKKTIESSSFIRRVNVKSMSPRSAVLDISYTGGQESLNEALKQIGFSLVTDAQGQRSQLVRGIVAPTNNAPIYYQGR